MARPKCCRRVSEKPDCTAFRPVGGPVADPEEIVLSMDEFEAIRLADLEGLYQEQAARRMNISRQTFGRIIETARRKVAQVLTSGTALRIEGGAIEISEQWVFDCGQCRHKWGVSFDAHRPEECPRCKGRSIHCCEDESGILGEGCESPRRGRCRHRA